VIKDYSPEIINAAATLLKEGQVVAFPTETVYGLGADATSDSAIKKIYEIKGRPANNPLIVHSFSAESAATWADLSNKKIKERFLKAASLWPGPLSLVVPVGSKISKFATAGHGSVALRVPDHKVALHLLRECNLPIAAPSANQSFYVSPTTAIHVDKSIGSKIPLIIDGGRCQVGLESTVIDLISESPTILRPGAVSAERLQAVLGEPVVQKHLSKSELDSGIISPGLLAKHYSPHTKLKWLSSSQRDESLKSLKRLGIVRFTPKTDVSALNPEIVVTLSQTGSLEEVASKLYEAIREMDDLNLELILIDSCSEDGLGRAIMDRIDRAVHK
jgi:L-threonylcarbamoyladenylate synthase